MLPHPTLKSSEEKRTARAAAAARALSASLRGIFYKLKALSSKLPPAFPYKLKANSYQLASLILLLALAITLGRLFLPGLIPAQAATQIGNSLRFTPASSQYFNRTPGSAGDRQKFTISMWVKRSGLGAQQAFYYAGAGSNFELGFDASDKLFLYDTAVAQKYSTAVFRDPSAWYHIVAAVDTTQGTASNRNRIYVNGVEVTSFSTNTDYSQNYTSEVNNSSVQYIGRISGSVSQLIDGYVSDFYMVDGQALTPSSFGETDSTTGAWQPKAYSGTYGTNGFHLTFSNSGALGTDSSGNGNTWTANNFNTYDQVSDTPTNNFATLSSINVGSGFGLSFGGLRFTTTGNNQGSLSTTAIASGTKAYFEFTNGDAGGGVERYVGVTKTTVFPNLTSASRGDCGVSASSYCYYNGDGNTKSNGSFAAYGNAWTSTTDVVGVAVDLSSGKIWFSKNCTWQASGDPAAGTNPAYSGLAGDYFAHVGVGGVGSGISGNINFGQGGTTTLSYNASAGGYFYCTPPSGFKALSTSNLPTPAIQKPSDYFDAKTYTGSGAATSTWPSFLNFTPTLTWLKDRTSANAHGLFDSVRAVFPYWSSNANTAETGGAGTTLTAFLSNGFSLGNNALFNTNGNSYISWNWKENTTAGFDIVTYQGTGANQDISHTLGAAPGFIIVKRRDTAADPVVFHQNTTNANWYLTLDSTAAQTGDATVYRTTPNSSSFGIGTNSVVNASGGTYVAYLWSEVPGYSKFGTYTGNGSADGPFVYTGFKPRYVMIKRFDTGGNNWRIWDTARTPNNLGTTQPEVAPDLASAEESATDSYDILSNGFKLRGTGAGANASSATYIYAAFADTPFQQSAQPYNLTIASSTRFVSGSSDYLNWTPGSAGNRTTYTLSTWFKQGLIDGNGHTLFSAGTAGPGGDLLYLASDKLNFYVGGATYKVTSHIFRDPATWYHLVVSVDTTLATAADRYKIYLNGQRITSFSTDSNPTQNLTSNFNNNVQHEIGRYDYNGCCHWDGYMSDAYFIDGQALDPSYFGEYDTNGFWRPKSYSGTYGTNGFHLPLMGTSTASGIGLDTSGNNNTWTVNNIATTDFVKDTPTNNFATMNPIDKHANYTLSSGNLAADSGTITGSGQMVGGSMWLTSGKWYWEFSMTGGTGHMIGVAGQLADRDLYNGYDAYGWGYYQGDGNKFNNGGGSGTAYGNSYTTNDVISVALDMDNAKIWWAKNGTWQASGDPAAGTNAAFTNLTIPVGPAFGAGASSNETGVFNFGQSVSPTSTATVLPYRSSAGGYFQYDPPSGFKALSTANMATPAITKPNNYFDAKTYTGSGAATSTWSGFLNFQPSLVWLKDRTSANAHGIFDSVRSVFPYFSSDTSLTTEVASASTTLTNFFSGGFSLGGSSLFNTSGNSYISWNWRAGTTPVSNTSGTITSTVSTNVTSGFSVVTYSGNASIGATIGHGLGATPSFILVRRRDASGQNIPVYHVSQGATNVPYLESTGAYFTRQGNFNNTAPNSTTFTVGGSGQTDYSNTNISGSPYVAYVWSEVPGFSKFGTYTGNGSADGPFVYTGFKPRWVMIKRTDTTGDWYLWDTTRDSYNAVAKELLANTTATDGSTDDLDMLANGFKLRATTAGYNASGGTYIYAAFAEIPFKYASAGATGLSVSSLFFNEF